MPASRSSRPPSAAFPWWTNTTDRANALSPASRLTGAWWSRKRIEKRWMVDSGQWIAREEPAVSIHYPLTTIHSGDLMGLYDLSAKLNNGRNKQLGDYKGEVLLIVNTRPAGCTAAAGPAEERASARSKPSLKRADTAQSLNSPGWHPKSRSDARFAAI